jgi:hypothetical protein
VTSDLALGCLDYFGRIAVSRMEFRPIGAVLVCRCTNPIRAAVRQLDSNQTGRYNHHQSHL